MPALVLMLAIVLAPVHGWAAQAYTTDTQEVPLQSAASAKSSTMMKIPPASEVELVKQPAWVLVRYTTPEGEAKQGWVSSSLLSSHPPDSLVIRNLREENKMLREQVEASEKEKQELARKDEEVCSKYAKLEAEHEALKSGSANYIQLKQEYDSLKTALAKSRENIQTLLQENESLKFSQTMKFFAAGAAVLLTGLFIGWRVGKQLRRRRSNYLL